MKPPKKKWSEIKCDSPRTQFKKAKTNRKTLLNDPTKAPENINEIKEELDQLTRDAIFALKF